MLCYAPHYESALSAARGQDAGHADGTSWHLTHRPSWSAYARNAFLIADRAICCSVWRDSRFYARANTGVNFISAPFRGQWMVTVDFVVIASWLSRFFLDTKWCAVSSGWTRWSRGHRTLLRWTRLTSKSVIFAFMAVRELSKNMYLKGLQIAWSQTYLQNICFHSRAIIGSCLYLIITGITRFKRIQMICFFYIDDLTMTADGVDTYHLVKTANRYK